MYIYIYEPISTHPIYCNIYCNIYYNIHPSHRTHLIESSPLDFRCLAVPPDGASSRLPQLAPGQAGAVHHGGARLTPEAWQRRAGWDNVGRYPKHEEKMDGDGKI